jgi:sugar lactone lactonase YvrE
MQIEVVVDAGAIIGESPTWAAAEQALYWIDVKKPALYRFDPATDEQRVWPMPGVRNPTRSGHPFRFDSGH